MAEFTATDQNFDSEVLKATQPVLIDFWAVWCVAPDTSIARNHLESQQAKNILVGDKLIGLNKTLDRGRVSYSKTTKDGGHCRRIRTVSGREIRLTDDHRIFTKRGWLRADELTIADRVAVFPMRDPLAFRSKNSKVLVDVGAITKLAQAKMKITKYIAELENKGLLPLFANHAETPRLARLVGALFSDGNLYWGKKNYREVSFVLGRNEDVEYVASDLRTLGFDKVHIAKRVFTNMIGGRTVTQHSYRVKCLSTALFLLLRALGVPQGSKFSQSYHVPDWIKNGDLAVKREFIAGVLGGDGPKISLSLAPRKNKLPYNRLTINDYEFHKSEVLIDNGFEFARELKMLLTTFGVRVKNVFVDQEKYLRKDGLTSRTIHLRFAHDFETGYALAQKIGYAYSQTKSDSAGPASEFLRIILKKRNSWQRIYKEAHQLAKHGLSLGSIAVKLGTTYDTIFGWIKAGKRASVPYHLLKFPDWFSKSTQGLASGFLWQDIERIEPVYLPTVQRISVDNTHNFIANGFLVHNCGPCQIQDPIVEEVAEELEGKVKVGKLNVDENPNISQRYMVMSIPTLMIFKQGTIVKQFIGVQSKQTILGELNKLIN